MTHAAPRQGAKWMQAAVLLAALLPAARAEVTQVSPGGFTLNFRAEISAPSADAWKLILQVPRWWSDAHTYSGKAANLSLDARAGGCWCEQWDGGASIEHARVVLLMPGRMIRLHGGLGPLQDLPVHGVLNIATGSQDGKSFLRLGYRVGGPAEAGLDKLAPIVDDVMGQQFKRLRAVIETGRPD